jgi:NCAIR mutase (PurE)-related protein
MHLHYIHTTILFCPVQALQPGRPRTRVLDAAHTPAIRLAQALENVALEQHTAAARCATPEYFAAVRVALPKVQYHAGAEMLLFTDTGADVPKPPKLPGRVAIVCGSSADLRGAWEAKVSVGLMGGYATIHQDVSVADLTSIVRARTAIAEADAVIVCCGEQPALAGIFAGMLHVPVIALPGVGSATPTAAVNVAGVSSVLLPVLVSSNTFDVLPASCMRSPRLRRLTLLLCAVGSSLHWRGLLLACSMCLSLLCRGWAARLRQLLSVSQVLLLLSAALCALSGAVLCVAYWYGAVIMCCG